MTGTSLHPLLEQIASDNNPYNFPIALIRKELDHLFLSSTEFEYFIMEAHKKLKNEYGSIVSHTFITILHSKFDFDQSHPLELPTNEYIMRIDDFISTLERIRITRIDKSSPDGELLSALS